MVCIYLTLIGPALLTTECLCLFSISNVLVKEVQWRSSSCLTCSDCFMDIFLHCITVSPFNTEFAVFDQCLIVTPRELRHWGWGSCKKSPVTRLQLSATFCRPSILYRFLSHSRARQLGAPPGTRMKYDRNISRACYVILFWISSAHQSPAPPVSHIRGGRGAIDVQHLDVIRTWGIRGKKLCRITVAMVMDGGLCRPCSKLVVGDRMALAHVLM